MPAPTMMMEERVSDMMIWAVALGYLDTQVANSTAPAKMRYGCGIIIV